jgi:hypothetical protein
MKPILLATALVCFTVPAFADHTPIHKQARAKTNEPTLASPDPKQRRAKTAKMGGVLGTDVTLAQARRVTAQTNREIARKNVTNKTASNKARTQTAALTNCP